MCGWSSDVVVETEFRHRDMLERPDDLDSWGGRRCVSMTERAAPKLTLNQKDIIQMSRGEDSHPNTRYPALIQIDLG